MAESLCVQCHRRPVDPDWRPFCSERCRLLDLGRWLDGGYRVPGEPIDTTSVDDADDGDGALDPIADPWSEPDDH